MVRVLSQIREDGKGQDVIYHFLVPLKHFFQILPDTARLRDLLQKPDISIQAIHVITIVGRSSRSTLIGQFSNLTQVPLGRKFKLLSLFSAGVEVCLSWEKSQILVYNAPMNTAVYPLAGFGVQHIRLGACITVTVVVMD